MERDLKKLISEMTLEEKAGLCSGKDFWNTKAIERLCIPSIMLTDGPHGLRKQVEGADHLGINESVPATCFPSGAGLASSWDCALLEEVGAALGEECQAENVAVLLGPAVNIKRSPLCGRNFEYFSEDPYLSTKMAASHIKGVQSQGVGTSLKHYAANNQEHKRMTVDAIVDERTLREIYLSSFEGAVKEAKPWTVMCAYNKVNGTYCSENKYLLQDILKDEWGFEGFVVSDWGAVNERVAALEAGLDLEMPSSYGIGDQKIIHAVKQGLLDEKVLDTAIERILRIIFKAVDHKKENAAYDQKKHHELARRTARECMVLLKNESNLLPLEKKGKLAVLGAFAKMPRFQGGGSSHVNPTQLDDVYEEIKKAAGSNVSLCYAPGYHLEKDDVDEKMQKEAQDLASQADVAVLFVGLPESYESEGYDRQHMRMPKNHVSLIEAVTEVQENVVLILSNGAPVEMPFIDKVKAVLEAYLGGQAFGGAIADLLFGDANPCGKLAETFPMDVRHNPSYLNFPGEGDRVEYREGIFVGYRYYEKTNTKVLFPFGHGLSYTTFDYKDLAVDKKVLSDQETLTVSVKVQNTGPVAGKEIVQLYVKDIESHVNRPEKELKAFSKVHLKPGEEKTVTFELGQRSFAYYNTEMKDFVVESGEFEILAGRSSADILLSERVTVHATVPMMKKRYHRNSTVGEILSDPKGASIIKQMGLFPSAEGQIPERQESMITAMIQEMPLRALVNFSQGQLTEEMLSQLLQKLNEE